MHTILDLKTDRSDAEADKSFEQTLVKAGFSSFFTHDNRSELTVITNEDYMLGSLQNRNQSFRFGGLSRFIDQNLSKFEVSDSSV